MLLPSSKMDSLFFYYYYYWFRDLAHRLALQNDRVQKMHVTGIGDNRCCSSKNTVNITRISCHRATWWSREGEGNPICAPFGTLISGRAKAFGKSRGRWLGINGIQQGWLHSFSNRLDNSFYGMVWIGMILNWAGGWTKSAVASLWHKCHVAWTAFVRDTQYIGEGTGTIVTRRRRQSIRSGREHRTGSRKLCSRSGKAGTGNLFRLQDSLTQVRSKAGLGTVCGH